MKNNMEIRNKAKSCGIRFWEIAAKLGINDGNFSRKLRQELPQEEKEKVLAIIDRLARERQEAG